MLTIADFNLFNLKNMTYLRKTWVRILVSLLAGGLASEILHISTGDPNRPTSSGESLLVLIFAVITFFLLTAIVNNRKDKLG